MLWATVFATTDCAVTLRSGDHSQIFSIPAGVTNLKLPLRIGNIAINTERVGSTVINYHPKNFQFKLKPMKCEIHNSIPRSILYVKDTQIITMRTVA